MLRIDITAYNKYLLFFFLNLLPNNSRTTKKTINNRVIPMEYESTIFFKRFSKVNIIIVYSLEYTTVFLRRPIHKILVTACPIIHANPIPTKCCAMRK